MNSIWTQIIKQTILRHKKKIAVKGEVIPIMKWPKASIEFKITAISLIKDILLVALGICSAAFGLKSFLLHILKGDKAYSWLLERAFINSVSLFFHGSYNHITKKVMITMTSIIKATSLISGFFMDLK